MLKLLPSDGRKENNLMDVERPRTGMSPELMLVLSLALKGGGDPKALINALMPAARGGDREVLCRLIAMYEAVPPADLPRGGQTIFEAAAPHLTGPEGAALRSVMELDDARKNAARLMRRIERARRGSDLAAMLDLISLLSPGTDLSGVTSMMNTMDMIKNMGSMDMSSIMSMMGMGAG